MKEKVDFIGKFVILGFGSVASSLIPLLFKHFKLDVSRVIIISSDDRNADIAKEFGLSINVVHIALDNYEDILIKFVEDGDFLINLSVDIGSLQLVAFCQKIGALYLDTCIEGWSGFYKNNNLSITERSNFALRQEVLDFRKTLPKGTPTAVMVHGMNPGLVSHFVKQALINMGKDSGILTKVPTNKAEWGYLAKTLGVKVIHIAEHDTQISSIPKKPNEFVNTWSVDGFISEGVQPAEMGWGSHEKYFPHDGIRNNDSTHSIILNMPGIRTKVKTWTPISKECEGFLVTHNESISISDYFSYEDESGIYRPTCHYAYRPCNDAILSIHELCGRNCNDQDTKRILADDITEGRDELGVLLMGSAGNSYWFGSLLEINEARSLAPFNTATSLQIVAGVLSGVVWAIKNPTSGIVEPEEMDFEFVLEVAKPYLGEMVGVYTDFTPLNNRSELFLEDLDTSDPFQFKNFRVS